MLVRTEGVKALDDYVCVFVHHVIGVETELPVAYVFVGAVHVLQHFRQVVERKCEKELVAFHEHAPGDEEEVDAVDCRLSVGVVVLDAVVAVFKIGVGVVVFAEQA